MTEMQFAAISEVLECALRAFSPPFEAHLQALMLSFVICHPIHAILNKLSELILFCYYLSDLVYERQTHHITFSGQNYFHLRPDFSMPVFQYTHQH